MTRTEIFTNIKSRITVPEINGDLIWCSDIRTLKNKATEVYEHENHLSLDFGEITIFNNIKLRFGTNSNDNYKLKSITGTYAKYQDAKALCDKLIPILNNPDENYDVEEQLFVSWADENIEIKVCTRDHHGGPWFEYSITKKNCT